MKKFIALVLAVIMSATLLAGCGNKSTGSEAYEIGVLLYKFDDTYISTVRQSLENIQKSNSGKVNFTFYDGKGDQNVQNDSIDTLLNKGVDMLLINMVDIGAAQTVVNKIKEKDIPVIFFNREPNADVLKSYSKARFVGTNAKDAGVMQGNILVNAWGDGSKYDTNKDGVMQYVMLKGEPDNPEAVARTEYSVSTLKDKGIKVEQLELQVCDWDAAKAQNAMEAWLSKRGDKIEVVIANNDGMAQGAIAALQALGYNKGGDSKTIPVVGVDATAAAQDLIAKGYMIGSVLQDAEGMANALFSIAMNMVSGKEALEGTEYKYDDTGIAVRIPYQEYTK